MKSDFLYKVASKVFLGFTTSGDLADGRVFGMDMSRWLTLTLIFFGISSFAFIWVWAVGALKAKKTEAPTSDQDE